MTKGPTLNGEGIMEQEPGVICRQCQCEVPPDCIDTNTGLCDECQDPPHCDGCGAVTSYDNAMGDFILCDECLKGTCKKCGAPGEMVHPEVGASDDEDILCERCFSRIFANDD